MSNNYYVYILTNRSQTLYIGVTNDLARRMHEHKQRLFSGFSKKYHLNALAYYEDFTEIDAAIAREK